MSTTTTHSLTTPVDGIRAAARQAFTDHLDLLSSGRIPEWVALFTEDGVLEFPYGPAGFPTHVTGHDELLAYMKNFPDHFEVAFEGLVFHDTTDPALVIAEFRSRGKARATGKPYNQTYISIVNTRDGKITRYVDFWNPLVAIESLDTGDQENGMVAAFGS